MGQQRGGREEAHPRRRQLDGQRQTIELAADRRHRRGGRRRDREVGPDRPGTPDEEGGRRGVEHGLRGGQRGGGQRQGRHGVELFHVEAQGAPARRQHRQAGAGGQQVAHQRGHRQEVLAVVEHEQAALVAQGGDEDVVERAIGHLGEPQRVGDGRRDQRRIPHRGQGDEARAVGEVCLERGGDRQRQASLADAAGAEEGDEAARVAEQQASHRPYLRFAAEERGAPVRQIRSRGHRAPPDPHGTCARV